VNEASRWRLDLARAISKAYEGHTAVRMTAAGGSAARGHADAYSDIDMAVYWDRVDDAWLETPPLTGDSIRRFTFLNVLHADPRIWLEQYFVGDVKVDVAHLPLDWLAEEVTAVQERFDTTPDRQEAFEGMLSAIPLFGADLYEQWRVRVAGYPDGLARAIVRAHLQFMPPWVLLDQGLNRGDLANYYSTLLPIITNVLNVLAGLNRRYLCTVHLKNVPAILETMPLKPPHAGRHIRALLTRQDFAQHYSALIEGTLALVEQYMPEVDTTAARGTYGFVVAPAYGPQELGV
jgi:hypothetical protein